MLIQPINETQQQRVCVVTHELIQTAKQRYDINLSEIEINFDLKGRAAGMYHRRKQERGIRYNPYLFAKYFDDNLTNTIPHEVAHYVADVLFGMGKIKPHGKEWRAIMRDFDVKPLVTGSYDLSGIPVRKQRRFDYQCDCAKHQLSTVRHNKIQKGKTRYYCQGCGVALMETKP